MQFHEACKKIAALKLVQASSGNLSEKDSVLKDSNTFYITASGAWFEYVEKDECVPCFLTTGEKMYSTSFNPSTEVLMHQRILKENEHIYVVLHCQPVYSTIIACAKKFFDFNLIPEIVYYIPRICQVPYYRPGSKELADSVAEAVFHGHEVVIMRNHGIVVVGSHFDEVIQKAVFFELACEILVKSPWELDRISK